MKHLVTPHPCEQCKRDHGLQMMSPQTLLQGLEMGFWRCVFHEVCSFRSVSLTLLRPIPPSPRLPWPWERRWQVIARTILPLLRLNRLIVHMHIVFHRGHVLMTKQFL